MPNWHGCFSSWFLCSPVSCISDPCGGLRRNLLEVRAAVKDAVCESDVRFLLTLLPSINTTLDFGAKASERRIPTGANREGVLRRTGQDQLGSGSNPFFSLLFLFSLIRGRINITGVLSICSELLAGIDECPSTSSPFPSPEIFSLFHYSFYFFFSFLLSLFDSVL